MSQFVGSLNKMRVEHHDLIDYYLSLGEDEIHVNSLLSKKIKIEFLNKIHCIHCHRETNKSFQQGFCFPCYRRLQECNLCIIHPERCLVDEGKCPDDDWAHAHCKEPHIIYLANSSGLKVGITRTRNMPSRWIDQGAIQALPILSANNRHQAGLIEVAFKQHVYDKTNWRAMLKNEVGRMDLIAESERLLTLLNADLKQMDRVTSKPLDFIYPVLQYPSKIVSLSLDKMPTIESVLLGIKGQYLIFESGVFNVRNFGGYQVSLTY